MTVNVRKNADSIIVLLKYIYIYNQAVRILPKSQNGDGLNCTNTAIPILQEVRETAKTKPTFLQ